MKNLKPDKIYLSLTNLNIQTFPHLCQEHCTYEFMNIFIYYYGGGGGGGVGRNKRRKENECTGSGVLQYLQRKTMMPAPVIIASKMSQYPGIMATEVEQHRI